MGFVIAVDGPAGSGKGTITSLVAERLGISLMDTGAMYRCVTVYFLRNGVDLEDDAGVKEALTQIDIDMEMIDGVQNFFLNGENVTKEIRTKEVDAIVSQVSHVLPVRLAMVDLQRRLARGKNIIMEGRDIGTNVFPDAECKIYLDATPEERARRRMKQNEEKGIEATYEEVLANVLFRDENDRTSDVAPLKMADDAVLLDSTNLSIEEVVEEAIRIIKEKIDVEEVGE